MTGHRDSCRPCFRGGRYLSVVEVEIRQQKTEERVGQKKGGIWRMRRRERRDSA